MTFDDEDRPWMTEKLKEKIKWKHKVYRDYLKNGKIEADYICMSSCYDRSLSTYFRK